MLQSLKNWPAWLIGIIIFEVYLLITIILFHGDIGVAFANPHLAILLGFSTSVAGNLTNISQIFRTLYIALAQGTWQQILFFIIAQIFCGAIAGQIVYWYNQRLFRENKTEKISK